MPRRLVSIALVVGCGPPDEAPSPPPPAPEEGCEIDPLNPLRAVCSVVREEAGPVEVVTVLDDGSVRTVPGDPDLLDQDIRVWDLVPEEPFRWEIREGDAVTEQGTLTAGSLPSNADVLVTVEVEGETRIERVLLPVSCDGPEPTLVVLDALGRVRWFASPDSSLLPVSFGQTADGTFAMAAGRYDLFAWAPDGTLIHDLRVGVDLERPMHHSLTGENGEILVLDATAETLSDGKVYIDEGITRVWPDGTSERAWNILQVVDPTGLGEPQIPIGFGYWTLTFDGAIDFAHVNGVALAGEGDLLISLKNLDTIVRLDPVTPAIEWALAGSGRAAAWLDLHLAASGDPVVFQAPHTPRLAPWGSILFMNSGLPPALTTVMEVEVDEEAATATTTRTWDLGVSCPVHSSVHGLDDGSVFAACAATGQLFELGDNGIRRRSKVTCAAGRGPGLVLGAQPIHY
jgi:hypothetical protein